MSDNMLQRRDFLKLGSAPAFAAVALSGCDVFSTEPAGERDSVTGGRDAREAPAIAELVKKGELPPLVKRLPTNPLVVEPVDRAGQYGGEWRRGMVGQAAAWLSSSVDYEGLVRWHPSEPTILPNVAEEFERDEAGTEYTFRLREGLRWSDGATFTADDVLFWYEDVLGNDEITPIKPAWMLTDDELGVVEKLDDFTVVFRFARPNGRLLARLATSWSAVEAAGGGGPTSYPKHYLAEFHLAHNPEGIQQLVEEAQFDDWIALFTAKSETWTNADRPTLDAWHTTSALGEDATQTVAERNPYYWKVDTDGRQLPYLDRVVHDVVGDLEAAVLKTQNGEYNLPVDINTLENKPVFASERARSGYKFIDTIPGLMNEAILFLNLTHKNPAMREVFATKDVRIGLSYAINRAELIEVVYKNQAEPWQAAPRPESEAFFDEDFAKQHLDYDVDTANEYLDRAGLSDLDGEGFRFGPDGKRISFSIVTPSDRKPDWVNVLELVRGYWRAVGIDMRAEPIGSSLFWTRMEGNDYDGMIWHGDGGLAVIGAPYYYFPFAYSCKFAPAWGHWYNGDPRGEEPPDKIKQQMETYHEIERTPEEDQQNALMKEILAVAKEEFFCIGTALLPAGYQVVTNDFRNVPEPLPYDWDHAYFARTNICQYYVER